MENERHRRCLECSSRLESEDIEDVSIIYIFVGGRETSFSVAPSYRARGQESERISKMSREYNSLFWSERTSKMS